MNREVQTFQLGEIPAAPIGERYVQLLRDYFQKEDILESTRAAFLTGIELFAGRSCRERCERDGLSRLHLHYPAEYTSLLEGFVNHKMKRRMLEWSAAVGRHTLGFRADFLVEDLLVVRIHYPHRHLGERVAPPITPALRYRIRYGLSSTIERLREGFDSKGAFWRPTTVLRYLRRRRRAASVPLAYRCHAPHKDSWLGQPVTSLSVWLAIAGVEEGNSMCLYPDTIGDKLPIAPSRYLDLGYSLPKPTRPQISDGDLYVFSTEILHSSQVNVSSKTRIALTTRIDPGEPKFDSDSLWFVQNWLSANEILSGRWRRKVIQGARNMVQRPGAVLNTCANGFIRVPGVFKRSQKFPVGPSSVIADGKKLVVQFDNLSIVILRLPNRLVALSSRCPHGGYQIENGYHDDRTVVCPGHGLEFDLETGRSELSCYRLVTFGISEVEGMIVLGD